MITPRSNHQPLVSLWIAPVFNQNDGRIARARAEIDQAARRYQALRQEIRLQVQESHTRYMGAWEEYTLWDRDVLSVLDRASDGCRTLLVAYFMEQRSYSEIAEEHGQPVGTVKSRLFRCLDAARVAVGGRGAARGE